MLTTAEEELLARLRGRAHNCRRWHQLTAFVVVEDLEQLLDLAIDQARQLSEMSRRGWRPSSPARADAPRSFRPGGQP